MTSVDYVCWGGRNSEGVTISTWTQQLRAVHAHVDKKYLCYINVNSRDVCSYPWFKLLQWNLTLWILSWQLNVPINTTVRIELCGCSIQTGLLYLAHLLPTFKSRQWSMAPHIHGTKQAVLQNRYSGRLLSVKCCTGIEHTSKVLTTRVRPGSSALASWTLPDIPLRHFQRHIYFSFSPSVHSNATALCQCSARMWTGVEGIFSTHNVMGTHIVGTLYHLLRSSKMNGCIILKT